MRSEMGITQGVLLIWWKSKRPKRKSSCDGTEEAASGGTQRDLREAWTVNEKCCAATAAAWHLSLSVRWTSRLVVVAGDDKAGFSVCRCFGKASKLPYRVLVTLIHA